MCFIFFKPFLQPIRSRSSRIAHWLALFIKLWKFQPVNFVAKIRCIEKTFILCIGNRILANPEGIGNYGKLLSLDSYETKKIKYVILFKSLWH